MPTPRYEAASGVINNQLYVVGGYNSGLQSVLEIYNPASNKWTPIPSLSTTRQGLAAAAVGGKLYAIGGMPDCCTPISNLDVYDPATNAWSAKAAMPTAREALAAGVIGTKIYVVGGNNGSSLSTLEIYDTTNNTWTSGASMPTPRDSLAVAVIGPKLYAIGGQDSNFNTSNTLEIYDSTNNIWSTGAPMPTARSLIAVGAIGTKIYVVGGFVSGVGGTNTLEIYNSANNTWSAGAPMLNAPNGMAAAVVNNQLYVVGGFDNSGYYLNDFNVYDPGSNTWSQKPPMPTSRYFLAAAAIGQTLYAVGGSTGLPTAKVEALASRPTIQKSFGVSTIQPNGITSLTFNLQNPNSYVALNGVAFTDNLPAGLTVAPTPNLSNTCGGTVTATGGSSSITLSGAALVTNASCTVSVDVKAVTGGLKNNTVTATSTTTGTDTSTGNASINVIAPPTIQKAFSAASIPLNGSATATFTINNSNTSTNLTGIVFSDTLPSSTGTLLVANPPNVNNTCGGTVTATAGTNLISLSGGSVAQNTSCTLTVDVQGTAAGNADNTTGPITSAEAGTGTTSNTATLKVVAPPTISKAFGAASIALNDTTTLTFTLTNPGANTTAESGIAFGDTLTNGLQVAGTPGVSNSCGGTVTATANSTSISLSGGSITTPGTNLHDRGEREGDAARDCL